MELGFLKGLPALLGIVGFFAYLWRGQGRIGADTTRLIIERLRNDPNVPLKQLDVKMSAAKLKHLVETDERVRRRVNAEQGRLLRQIVHWQNAVTLVVFLACAGLVALAIMLISRPLPLEVTLSPPRALVAREGKPLLDLDQIVVNWSSKGVGEQVQVFLENVDSGTWTPVRTVASDVGTLTFDPKHLREVASDRAYGGRNRVRSVVKTSTNIFKSATVDLAVGIQIRLYTNLGGGRAMIFPTIWGKDENIPPGFCFDSTIFGYRSGGDIKKVEINDRCKGNRMLTPSLLSDFDWSRPIGLLYSGPRPELVRTCLYGPRGSAENNDFSCQPGQVDD
jgi:hypothetical protein